MDQNDIWLKEKLLSDEESTFRHNEHILDAENQCHALLMLYDMHDCFKQKRFCDFTLTVGHCEIGVHKLVLSSFSMFFRKLFENDWKDCEQDKFQVKFSDEATLRYILSFAYTGELHLHGDNALSVLKVCDFLQVVMLDFVKESCSDFWIKQMNTDNCVAMLRVAELYNVVELKYFTLDFISKNFYRVSQSEDFVHELPPELVIRILKSDPLIVDLGKDFLPSPVEQEDYILRIVLKYISHQCESDSEKGELLRKLLGDIRLGSLSSSSKKCLQCFAQKAGCSDTKEFMNMMRVDDDDRMSQPRFIGIFHLGLIHANQFITWPELYRFGNSYPDDANLYVTGLKIWTRLLEDHPVICGLQVFYSNGDEPIYGSNDEETDFDEFHLESDERVVKAEVSSWRMINSLIFFTNKGRQYGPFGTPSEHSQIEESKGKYSFLSYFVGTIVEEPQGHAIVIKLQLVWKRFLVDSVPLKKRALAPTL